MNSNKNILIIGAGAAGLLAAKELVKNNFHVTILEARERPGGRIHTIQPASFELAIEGGAEFIHGDAPNTVALLKEANILHHRMEGSMWQFKKGVLRKSDEFIEGWELLVKKMNELKEDIPVKEFIDTYFGSPEHADLRKSITGFVEGYDAADISLASVFAFREELSKQSEEEQYRVEGGYINMIIYLEKACTSAGCEIHYDTKVEEVIWKEGKVELIAKDARFQAEKLIVTVPVEVLRSEGGEGYIRFTPSIEDKLMPMRKLGYGPVIKIIIQFDPAFWQTRLFANGRKDASFIFSDETIPTWWTQYPDKSAVLTGWVGGPKAAGLNSNSEEQIFELAMESFGHIMSHSSEELKSHIKNWRVFKWQEDVFAKGAYSYLTVESEEARAVLREPVANTIYFAGEGIAEGSSVGTVEAALSSGRETAELIRKLAD